MSKNKSIQRLSEVVCTMHEEIMCLYNHINAQKDIIDQLTRERDALANQVMELFGNNCTDESESSSNAIPVAAMSTTIPDTGMFSDAATTAAPKVTTTTKESCLSLTAVLQDTSVGVSAGKRILSEQGLYNYEYDNTGKNRFTPTKWFLDFGKQQGLIAEFTGHADTKNGHKTYTWYKITAHGADIIKKTVAGEIIWNKSPLPTIKVEKE